MTQSQGSYDDIAALIEAFGGTPGSGGLGELLQTLASAIRSGGGSEAIVVEAAVVPASPAPVAGLSWQTNTQVSFDPAATVLGTVDTTTTIPPITYAAGTVVSIDSVTATMTAPSTVDSYVLQVIVLVTNAAATEVLILGGVGSIAKGSTSLSIATTTFTPTLTGSDLSYDSATGVVSSAAGGTYSIVVQANGDWN